MKVLSTHYLSRLNIGSNSIYLILGELCILLFAFLFLYTIFSDTCTLRIFIAMNILFEIGFIALLIALKMSHTPTNYIDYKEVLFENNEIEKEIFGRYKIKEIKGDIYVIEPINPIEEERKDET